MKKCIRLLVENLFDDLYDIDQENNLTIDIADKIYYNYHPKTKKELEQLLKQLLEERGPDADLNDIDTSQITDMSSLFNSFAFMYDIHKIDIRFWDVSNVTDMSYMFNDCVNFNCDLSSWDVSNVENMNRMFDDCLKFTGKGLENWNVSNVTDMSHMFFDCKNFNCDLGNWDVSNVRDMQYMFWECKKFKGKGLDKWKPIKCIYMTKLFSGCSNFDCDLRNWDVSNVINMDGMFDKCEKFKGQGLETWKPIKCTSMQCIFWGCEKFKGQGLETWKPKICKNMSCMFYKCENFDCNLSNWDVKNVTDMRAMFSGCYKFKGIGLENWNPVKLLKLKTKEEKLNGIFNKCDSLKEYPDWYTKIMN